MSYVNLVKNKLRIKTMKRNSRFYEDFREKMVGVNLYLSNFEPVLEF